MLGLSVLYFLCSSSHLLSMSQIRFATTPAPTDTRNVISISMDDHLPPPVGIGVTDKWIIPHFLVPIKGVQGESLPQRNHFATQGKNRQQGTVGVFYAEVCERVYLRSQSPRAIIPLTFYLVKGII